MIYLCYTYVDALTGVSCLAAPMAHGPANPAVPGLQFGFALESRYPTPHPVFYGACPDDTPAQSLALPGVLAVLSPDDYAAAKAVELEARKTLRLLALAAERYAVETGGIEVLGIAVRTDRASQAMLTGALAAIQSGAVASVDWKGGDGWHALTAEQISAVAQAVTQHVQQCFSAERVASEAIMASGDFAALDAVALWLPVH